MQISINWHICEFCKFSSFTGLKSIEKNKNKKPILLCAAFVPLNGSPGDVISSLYCSFRHQFVVFLFFSPYFLLNNHLSMCVNWCLHVFFCMCLLMFWCIFGLCVDWCLVFLACVFTCIPVVFCFAYSFDCVYICVVSSLACVFPCLHEVICLYVFFWHYVFVCLHVVFVSMRSFDIVYIYLHVILSVCTSV